MFTETHKLCDNNTEKNASVNLSNITFSKWQHSFLNGTKAHYSSTGGIKYDKPDTNRETCLLSGDLTVRNKPIYKQ